MRRQSLLKLIFLFIFPIVVQAKTLPIGQCHWLDLSHDFAKETVYWPGDEQFSHIPVFVGITQKGYFYSDYDYTAGEHGGTHADAPSHFSRIGLPINEIPLTSLTGPAVVIDVRQQVKKNRNYLVSPKDFTLWEAKHGHIPQHSIVLINTGFSAYWPNHEAYLGTAKTGKAAQKDLQFPGIGRKAAYWLEQKRNIKAVGIDTASIDRGKSKNFEAHQAFADYNIPILENLTKLYQLPATGSYIIALPMKIKNGGGAPLRIIACVQTSTLPNQAHQPLGKTHA